MQSLGIDVGNEGAFALIQEKTLRCIFLVDMPVMALTGTRRQMNAAEIARIIKGLAKEYQFTAFLERVSAMPGQGVCSMFSFGTGYGVIQGVLAAMGIPTVLVTPQSWKKDCGLIGQPKDMARTVCQRLYPDIDLSKKKYTGRADAILIARHGIMRVGGSK